MDIRSKRNRALSVVTAATLAASLGVPAVAVADEAAHSSRNVAVDGQNEAQASGVNDVKAAAIVQVNGVEYDSFEGALAAIAATDVANVKLLDSIEVSSVLTIGEGKTVNLDMNGKAIAVSKDFSGGRPITNKGTLVVSGEGTIGSEEENCIGAIRNDGVLTIENGTFLGHIYGGGGAIRNGVGAEVTIEGGTFKGATTALYNAGEAFIYGGSFEGKTCSTCNSSIWAYTVQNVSEGGSTPKMVIDEKDAVNNPVMITGTQGALSASAGYLEVTGGTYETVDCEKGHGAVFYALYVAGEDADVKAVVNDGSFKSAKRSAVLVGNDNTNGDGGINANATTEIKGGVFIAPEGVDAVTGAPKTGNPVISAGKFSSTVDAGYIDPASVFDPETNTVAPRTADSPDSAVAIGDKYYGSLNDALSVAEDGDTVRLVDNVEMAQMAVVDGKRITLDLNGETITNTKDIWAVNNWSLVSLRNGAEMTVCGNGAMRAKENDCYVFDVQSGSRLTVNDDGVFVGNLSVVYLYGKSDLVINGGEFSLQQLDDEKDYQFMLNCLDKDYESGDAVVKVNGGVFHGFNPGANAAESGDMSTNFLADGATVAVNNQTVPPTYTVSPRYVPPTPPAPAPNTEVEQRPDGSTVTTVTKPDGSQTVTTEAADGSQSVVSKDADGNVASAEVSVSDKAAEAGEVVLPLDPSKPAADAGKAPAIEVDMPASVTAEAPVKVTVPVDVDGPGYGVVVYAVDADGNEAVLPKCGVDADGNAVFEAAGDVTIKVVDASASFPDVAGTWYGKQGVADFVGARGILTGVPQADGALHFAGDEPTTRAMFVTMLHRAESCPDAPDAGFADAEGMWFEKAAAWGEASGVVDGYGGASFGGEDPVTREQMAVFLMRYAGHLGLDVSKRADLSAFPDGAETSAWASQAMSWAVAEGLFSGRDGQLDPTDGATRAEASAVVMRFINGLYA